MHTHLLAQVEGLVGQPGPAALQADLKQAAHQAARRLRHIHHVTAERQALQLEVADVRLGDGRKDTNR